MPEISIQHHKKAAGHLLSSNVPTVLPGATIAEARQLLTQQIHSFDSINYIYVVNQHHKLEGVISIKGVLSLPSTTVIRTVMVQKLLTARPHSTQEHVALLALKHKLKAIPVINSEDVFLGAITSDSILEVMSDELTEDMLHLAGITKDQLSASNIIHSSFSTLIKVRLPWLLVGLAGGILAAQVVGFFETLLEKEVILVLFLPIMVYMSDAVGSQTQTIFIRAMATVDHLNIRRYFVRELLSGVVLAIILGIILSGIVLVWQQNGLFALILGIALFFTIISAVAIALFVPLLLTHFKKDPAVGSGPFATIMRDVLSIVIYFGAASLLLNMFERL